MNLTKFTEAYKKVLTESTDDSELRNLVRDIVEEVRNKHLEEDYKTSEKRFLDAGADPEEVKKILAFHRDNKNTFKPELKNIDAQEDWKEFSSTMLSLMKQKEVKQEFKTIDQVTLRDDNEWLIVVPLNHGTSCFRGSDTNWCTTKPDREYFSKYFYEAKIILVYCIKKNQNKDKWAAALHLDKLDNTEFFDKINTKINKDNFENQTNLSFNTILDGIKKNLDYINQKRVLNSQKDLFFLIKKAKGLGKPDPNLEAQIIVQKSVDAAYQYAKDVLNGPFPKGEELIAKDPVVAYEYARDVLKGPFPKGEDAIAKDPNWAYEYARYVLKGPFPKGEDAIAEEPSFAYSYALDVLKGPFPKGEETIAGDADSAYEYALNVLGGPFPEGEYAIAEYPELAYKYAQDVLKLKDPESWPDNL